HMGLFFYTKISSIISIGDLPTTNIIEPKNNSVISSRIYSARDYGVFLMRKEWRHSRDSLRELRVLNY
ncbi:TPA: hypothetical protein ACL2T2_001986, partial [Streptococcus pneumoniae]